MSLLRLTQAIPKLALLDGRYKERGFWVDIENQKKFLQHISTKFSIQEPSDWGKIGWKEIASNGGKRLLDKYGGNVVTIFKSLYPGSHKRTSLLM